MRALARSIVVALFACVFAAAAHGAATPDPKPLTLHLEDFPPLTQLAWSGPTALPRAEAGYGRDYFPGTPTRVDSIADVYAGAAAAHADLVAYAAGVASGGLFTRTWRLRPGWKVHRSVSLSFTRKGLGTEARLYHTAVYDGVLREWEVYTVVWRDRTVDAVVTTISEVGTRDPGEALALARKQETRIRAALG